MTLRLLAGESLGCAPLRKHWLAMQGQVAALVAVTLSALLVAALLVPDDSLRGVVEAVVLAGSALVGTAMLLSWRRTRLIVTDQRLLIEDGLIHVLTTVIPLDRVVDAESETVFRVGNIEYGTVTLRMAGRGRPIEVLTFVSDPHELAGTIAELAEHLRRGTDEEDGQLALGAVEVASGTERPTAAPGGRRRDRPASTGGTPHG